jgi:hypothetical protein
MSAFRIQPLLHAFTAFLSHRAVPLALIAILLGAVFFFVP